ncbi:hypothetical protein ACFX2G_035640 [Malus domestica]
MTNQLESLVESIKSKVRALKKKSKKPYIKMDKSSSVKVEIRSKRARKLIDKTLKAADRPGTKGEGIDRRILHQPLFPDNSSPPPDTPSPPIPPPPSPDTSSDQPFFHELPSGSTPDQTQPAPLPLNATTVQNPQVQQPTKGTKKVAIAALVGIVTLRMLSKLAFFLYRHQVKHPSESQKLVNGRGPGPKDSPTTPQYEGDLEMSNEGLGPTDLQRLCPV